MRRGDIILTVAALLAVTTPAQLVEPTPKPYPLPKLQRKHQAERERRNQLKDDKRDPYKRHRRR